MTSRLPLLLVAALLVVGAGCSGDKKAAPPPTTTPEATAEWLFVIPRPSRARPGPHNSKESAA